MRGVPIGAFSACEGFRLLLQGGRVLGEGVGYVNYQWEESKSRSVLQASNTPINVSLEIMLFWSSKPDGL
jgi:hypothetical protein